jgi:predicted transcriptional regulator
MAGLDTPEVPADIFMELASETRCSMLLMLDEQPRRANELAKKLNLTVQEAHRNTTRLLEAGIIEKSSDGLFALTEYGRIIMTQISCFQFLKTHRQFFKDHTLGDIPAKFIQRIGALENCKVISGVTAIFEKLKKLESGANENLKIMVSQAWPEEGRILVDRATHGIKVRALVGRNTVFPKEVVESVVKEIQALPSKADLENRMVDKVSVALYLADNQSGVMFANSKGDVDMGTLFVSDDPVFNEWCFDLFSYTWEHSKPFDVYKTKIVES